MMTNKINMPSKLSLMVDKIEDAINKHYKNNSDYNHQLNIHRKDEKYGCVVAVLKVSLSNGNPIFLHLIITQPKSYKPDEFDIIVCSGDNQGGYPLYTRLQSNQKAFLESYLERLLESTDKVAKQNHE